MRRGFPPEMRLTNASVRPLVSPLTRFEACDRNATQDGFARKPPLTAAPHEAPLAGPPFAAREISTLRPILQAVPLLLIDPVRRTTKTSRRPLASPATRVDGSGLDVVTSA